MRLFYKLKGRLILLLLFLAAFYSCTESNNKERLVKELMKSEMVLPCLNSDSKTDYTIFRYVKPKSCTSCQLQMGKWRIYKRRMEKKYGDTVSFLFLIDTSVPDEAQKLLEIYNFENNCIVDSIHSFINQNPIIQHLGNDLTMLLDRNNKIILIGDPCEYNKIDSLYRQIIGGKNQSISFRIKPAAIEINQIKS